MTLFTRLVSRIRSLPARYTIGGAVVLVALIAVGVHAITRPADTAAVADEQTHVSIASVASLSSASGPLPVTGTVKSQNQATILAQTSGEIVSLSRTLGDRVAAGSVIGSFENSSQQAAVLQAQGSYAAAQAALEKAQGTTAANAGVTAGQASQNVTNTQTAALAALKSAYAALDDAVHTRADALFTNPKTASAALILTVPDAQLVSTVVNERIALEATLQDARTLSSAGTAADIDANSQAMAEHAREVETFLDNLVKAVNATPPSQTISATTLGGYQTSLATARTETIGAISGVTTAKSAYDAAVASAATAANSADSSSTIDVKVAQANLEQAQGALAAAKAALEKTIVRSPISGTIVSLPVNRGDFVSAFSPVAEVSNPGALYVDTHVTPSDAKTIAVGNKALMSGSVPGVVTFVAPALDPATGKIEVKIGITGSSAALTDGEAVALSIERTGGSSATADTNTDITIPITAVKITPQGPVVFTVGTTSALAAHPITLGSILGDRVIVADGLTTDLEIVTDARGLAVGQTVVVNGQ